MYNKILWTLNNEIDGKTFERLCVDLLFRNGYKDIVPIEPQDGGRDAEEFPRQGRSRDGESAFFQFSLEQDWKSKIKRDAGRLHERGYEFTSLIFVTNQKARGIDVDSLHKELKDKYNWVLIVYSREWLRFQIEEVNPDLAIKYLGVEIPSSTKQFLRGEINKPKIDQLSEAWNLFDSGDYDEAAPKFKAYLTEQPEDADIWKALAWSQYSSYQYDEALSSIYRSLKLKDDIQSKMINGCILAEKGIKESDRPLVIKAKRKFKEVENSTEYKNWNIYYNLGNVESALGENDHAISNYRKALEENPNEPMILKNLASAYHLKGDHESEIKYLNKVLEINPTHPEGLVSKGISLLVDFQQQKPSEAIDLLERALKFNPDWSVQWFNLWYYLGLAYYKNDEKKKGLNKIEEGLAHQPGHLGMKKIKSDILNELIDEDPELIDVARTFWQEQLIEEPMDYVSRSRLVLLEHQENNRDTAWKLLQESFDLIELSPVYPLQDMNFNIQQCIKALNYLPNYKIFRQRFPLSDYWNTNDSLYDLAFNPPKTDQIKATLNTYLLISFGLSYDFLEMSNDRYKITTLINFFDSLKEHLEHSISESSVQLINYILSGKENHKKIQEKKTECLWFLGLIALREFGRQRGWIISQFKISQNIMNSALKGYNEELIEENVINKSLLRLNKELGLT